MSNIVETLIETSEELCKCCGGYKSIRAYDRVRNEIKKGIEDSNFVIRTSNDPELVEHFKENRLSLSDSLEDMKYCDCEF